MNRRGADRVVLVAELTVFLMQAIDEQTLEPDQLVPRIVIIADGGEADPRTGLVGRDQQLQREPPPRRWP